MAQYQIGAPGVSLSGTITVPDQPTVPTPKWPAIYRETFDGGIGHWTAPGPIGGPREVVNGIFRSWDWSYDSNHLTPLGGPGMLHLLAYADDYYFNHIDNNGALISSDFTNAKIKMRARGVNFQPNGSQWIIWITANHPTVAGKNVNWGMVGKPMTPKLLTGNWEDIEILIDPDPSKWVWGKGANGSIYDTFLSLPESLRNIYNLHMPMLGPDNVAHPTGQFELDTFEIVFARNGPDLEPEVEGTVVFDPPLNTASIGNSGYSIRGITSAIATGGTKIRVTFKAPSSATASAGHVSIGKQSNSYNTVATPVELKFSGASGFSLAAGGQITSDWMDFVSSPSDVLVTVIDSTSAGQIRTSGAYGGGTHYNLAGTSYNQATPSGFTDSSSQYFGGKVEVKT